MSSSFQGPTSGEAAQGSGEEIAHDDGFAAAFVRDPDLLPLRLSGQCWGDRSIALDLPAGPYRIHGLTAAQVEQLREKYGRRAKDDVARRSAIDVSAFQVATSEFLPHPLDGAPYRMQFEYGVSRIRIVTHDFVGLMQLDGSGAPGRCGIFSGDEAGLLEGGSLENLLRVVMAYSALARGGLLLHSAAVLRKDQAFVFVGKSGAGKSTVSRLSAEAGLGVLSDDINVLLPDPDTDDGLTFAIEQVPFAGDFRDAPTVLGRHPVAGILALRHGERHRVEPISPARGSAVLAAHAPFVNSDPERSDTLLSTAASLVARLPTNRLDFLPDAGFWELL